MMNAKWASYEDRLSRVTGYIYDHLDDDLDIERLADVAAMSPWHWHRIYHAMRGETVAATVKRLRLQRAATLLAQTKTPIAEIAIRSGFSGAPAFTRAFAEAYGLPPAKYREEGSHTDFPAGTLHPPRRSWAIEIKALPELPALAMPHIGSYMQIGRAFETLFGALAARQAMPNPIRMIGIYGDDPTTIAEDKLRSHAALIGDADAAAPVERHILRGGDYAVLRHKGPYADMRPAYLWLFGTWLPQSGREAADAPVLEEYLNSPQKVAPTELLSDILLPLK